MKHIPDRFRKIMIIFFWLCLWQVLTMVVDNDIFLVGPMETLAALAGKAGSPDFFKAVWFSFTRISLGFFCAFLPAPGTWGGAFLFLSKKKTSPCFEKKFHFRMFSLPMSPRLRGKT